MSLDAVIVNVNNPLCPWYDREITTLPLTLSINDYVNLHPDLHRHPFICIVNGDPVLRANWSLEIKQGDIVVFMKLPQGGGGGRGGKNPLMAILGIAVMAVGAIFTGGLLAVGLVGVGAAMTIMGSGLLGLPEMPTADKLPSASPTYTLSAQGNSARIGQAIPVVYGRHLIYPDFAEQPYYEFHSNEQYLYHVLMIGQGHHTVHNIKIEDTDISNFKEISYKIINPDEPLVWKKDKDAYFVNNVVSSLEVANIELPDNDKSKLQSELNALKNKLSAKEKELAQVKIDLSKCGCRGKSKKGKALRAKIAALEKEIADLKPKIAELEKQTSTANEGWVGPFVINPTKTKTKRIGVDIVLPRGLYDFTKSPIAYRSVSFSFQFRRVDDRGNPAGEWWSDASAPSTTNITLKAKSPTPIRKTYFVDLPDDARWEMRVSRTSVASKDSKIADMVIWAGAKAYLSDKIDYSGMTLLLVKMKATNNLSGRASRKLNCLVTRRLRKWDPKTEKWSVPEETASPVWALADILQADYGAKMQDEFLSLSELHKLDELLERRGDRFNAIYDRKMSLWEAVKLCSRCARSAGVLQGGIFRAVRDAKQNIPTGMFSGRNIVKNSFSIKYSMASEDTVGGVSVEFLNGDYWKPEEVEYAENVETGKPLKIMPDKLAKVKFFGCTEEMQAKREAIYLARNNMYRRKYITFKTELEGYIPTFGDLIAVSHDMPNWGQFGEIKGFDTQNNIIALTEPLAYKDNIKHYMVFRNRNGSMSGPWEVSKTSDSYKVKLHGNWDYVNASDNAYTIATSKDLATIGETIRMYHGTSEERTHYAFGEENKIFQYAVVKSVVPRGEMQVEIQCISEDNRVHEDVKLVSPTFEKLAVIPKTKVN